MVPYSTFGRSLDMDRYHWLSRQYEVPLVVDAASSLGTIDEDGLNAGTGTPGAFVYSMHATKTFATAEGGVVYSADVAFIDRLRVMSNYGFEHGRSATMPGLNAKISEVGGLMALAKLDQIDAIAEHRAELAAQYHTFLPEYGFQPLVDHRQAMQFMPLTLPSVLMPYRTEIIAKLAECGIGAGTYFSPHLAQQPYFQAECSYGALPMSDDVGGRIIALPITDMMSVADVKRACIAFREICAGFAHPVDRRIKARQPRKVA
jgi:dTDP-4-amino-4,6-dideoxygalactose transaminase